MSNIFKFHRRTMKAAVSGLGVLYHAVPNTFNSKSYYIANKANGQTSSGVNWGRLGTKTNLTSTINGYTNSETLKNVGVNSHPAAYFCRTLNLGGYTDWYLPAIDEWVHVYNNIASTGMLLSSTGTHIDKLNDGSYYHSSTEDSRGSYAGNYCKVLRGNGSIVSWRKDVATFARAVRSI